MGNVKVGRYCYLTVLFDKSFTEMFLSSPLQILSKPLNLIGCHGNQKDKFAKKKEYSKIISEAVRGGGGGVESN